MAKSRNADLDNLERNPPPPIPACLHAKLVLGRVLLDELARVSRLNVIPGRAPGFVEMPLAAAAVAAVVANIRIPAQVAEHAALVLAAFEPGGAAEIDGGAVEIPAAELERVGDQSAAGSFAGRVGEVADKVAVVAEAGDAAGVERVGV